MPRRIVQLSDLHLTPRVGRSAWGADVWGGLDTALSALDAHEPFDRLVISGDLANRSSRSAYEALRRRLERWADRLRLVPGNHDGRGLLREIFATHFEPGTARFVDVLGPDLALIGLDSKRAFRVLGRIGEAQLTWLQALLDSPPAGAVFLFLHHPLVPIGTWWLDKDRPRDADALVDVIDRAQVVRGVFCGHVHQDFQAALGSRQVPFMTCPSTAYQFKPRAGRPAAIASRTPALRVIDWTGDAIETHVQRFEDA